MLATMLLTSVQALEASIIDHNVKLVLVDSIAALARSEFNQNKIVDRQQMLGMPSKHQATCLCLYCQHQWSLHEQAITNYQRKSYGRQVSQLAV